MTRDVARHALLPLFLALLVTLVLWRTTLVPHHKAPMGQRTVASFNLTAGTLLNAHMLSLQHIAKSAVSPFDIATPAAASGMVLTVPLSSGEAVRQEDLKPLANAGLSYQLAPNQRAISLATNAVSGVAGYLQAGDRVDVIAVATLPQGGAKARLLLSCARILAVGNAGAAQAGGAATGVYPTATVAAPAASAQAVAAAEAAGVIDLGLCPHREAP